MVFFQKGKYKKLKIALICVLSLLLASMIAILSINTFIKITAEDAIASGDTPTGYDCILVLGASVRYDQPSHMLEDRLLTAIELYKNGAAPKLLMSGDHGSEDYDEVGVMKSFAISHGVPSEDIFMDHAGFSTYESIFRARDVFAADKIIIVTQEYHLYRALHVANALGVEAYGVAADYHTYVGQAYRELREILARNKDFATSILKPEPTYLGDVIPVSGDGNLTNDEDMEPVFS